MIDESGQRWSVQLGVHIVHDYGKLFVSLLFNVGKRGQPERGRDHLGLPRTHCVSDASAGSPQAQVMPVGTIAGEPG